MRKVPLVLLALPLVAACATTPLQKCEATYKNQLHNLRDDISETQLALRRGFRLVPATTTTGLHYCVSPGGLVTPCLYSEDETLYDKIPINRKAESAKLATLQQEEVRLDAGLAACATQYPE